MSKVTHFVDDVPVYGDYVYLEDWARHMGDWDMDHFEEWAEENELIPQAC